MKALILTLLAALTFSLNAQANEITPDQMTPAQQQKLIQLLNQLEPEILDHILSEEALNWYIQQFNRMDAQETSEQGDLETFQSIHGRKDLGFNPFNDPNAPKF